MLTEVALVVGLVLLAAGLWRRGGARYGWATALLGALIVAATLLLSARTRMETRRRQGTAAAAAPADSMERVVDTGDGSRLTQTPAGLRLLQDLRRDQLGPPKAKEVIDEAVSPAA